MARDKKGKASNRTQGIPPISTNDEREFDIRHGLRILREAEEIKSNKSLMKDISKEASAQMQTLQRLKGKFK